MYDRILFESLRTLVMNFVSPRKLDRIHSFDVVFNDVLAGIINVWWFVDYFGLDENAVSFSFFRNE